MGRATGDGGSTFMEFHTFKTTRDAMRPYDVPDVRQFYAVNIARFIEIGDKACVIQAHTEMTWEEGKRPFYNVYPSIAPMLLRLNLNFDSSLVKMPHDAFCIRFPKGQEPIKFDFGGKTWPVRTMLAGPTSLHHGKAVFEGIVLWVDFGEIGRMSNGFEWPVCSYINLPMEKGLSVERSLAMLPYDPSSFTGVIMPPEIRTACVKLACTVCLLGDDPSLIEPDVLDRDRAKYWQDPRQEIVDRAHRRGKIGWNIGRTLEMIPHYRRPHLTLVWTGKGRTVAKIVPRKGSIVHREIVSRVPSGFEGWKDI
jgi:hypothetical protein